VWAISAFNSCSQPPRKIPSISYSQLPRIFHL